MIAALETLRGEYGDGFALDVIDVDADPALQARYDDLVPVLVTGGSGDVRALCHYFLDATVVKAYLGELGIAPAAVSDPVQPRPRPA